MMHFYSQPPPNARAADGASGFYASHNCDKFPDRTGEIPPAVASAPAAFRVRVWQITSGGRRATWEATARAHVLRLTILGTLDKNAFRPRQRPRQAFGRIPHARQVVFSAA